MKEYTVRVSEDGTKAWFLNGKCHREDGPAIERADGTKEWLLNGQLHREDGPAIERADGTKYWWLNDNHLTEEEHNRRTTGVTMDGALEAADGVILREQAARIKELEDQNKELLEALCYLLLTSTGLTHEEWLEAMDQARAAIAQAKGE